MSTTLNARQKLSYSSLLTDAFVVVFFMSSVRDFIFSASFTASAFGNTRHNSSHLTMTESLFPGLLELPDAWELDITKSVPTNFPHRNLRNFQYKNFVSIYSFVDSASGIVKVITFWQFFDTVTGKYLNKKAFKFICGVIFAFSKKFSIAATALLFIQIFVAIYNVNSRRNFFLLGQIHKVHRFNSLEY